MDAGYKTPWICKRIYIRRWKNTRSALQKTYEQEGFLSDCVICPENRVLKYITTNREGYREFKSAGYICESCPKKYKCTENAKCEKTVAKHIWENYLDKTEDIRHTPKYKDLYEKRKETIERVFADAKERHAMRFTFLKGLAQITNWIRLKFATMNLKKFAIRKWYRDRRDVFCFIFCYFKTIWC